MHNLNSSQPRLCEKYRGYIIVIAKKFARHNKILGLDDEDFISVAMVAVCEAEQRWPAKFNDGQHERRHIAKAATAALIKFVRSDRRRIGAEADLAGLMAVTGGENDEPDAVIDGTPEQRRAIEQQIRHGEKIKKQDAARSKRRRERCNDAKGKVGK